MGRRIGFIGAGMMAEALIGGIRDAGLAEPQEMMASDISEARRSFLAASQGILTTARNGDVVDFADTVILAVKPQHFGSVLDDVGGRFGASHLVVSIMAGVSTAAIEARLSQGVPVIRVMPNILCLVKEAASAVTRGCHATPEHEERAKEILAAVGRVVSVDESLMDAVTGLSGSGPAYVFTVIESLADGAVAEGLPRETALTLAAQTVLGAGKMLLESGEHPGVLRDRVTSPAGTTAEGLAVLEAHGVRSGCAEAVRAAAKRSRALGEGAF